MEKRTVDLETADVSLASFRADATAAPNPIPCPAPVVLPSKYRHRRKRLLPFLVLEITAVTLLIVLLLAGTSSEFAQPTLTRPFLIAIFIAASLVVIIPVVFYGRLRQRYTYRDRRLR